MPDFTVDDQIKNLSDEELQQMIQQTEQIKKDSMAQNVSGALLGGARGALLASQGQPLPAPTQEKQTLTPDQELDIFEKKERIKAKIKAEFGGGGGLQIVQLPGGGFAVVPGGQKTAEGVSTEIAQTTDAEGKPVELEDVKVDNTGKVSGNVPKSEGQLDRELDEGEQKRFKELKFDLIKGRLVNGNNLELLSGVTRDLSQLYADAHAEGGAGGVIQSGLAGAAEKFGDVPEFLGGAEVGGRFPASGAFAGKRNELILKMMPMLTQQATKSEGSVRIVSSVLEAIGATIPELRTAPKQADRQLTETLRTFYRFARGAERLNISLDDEFQGRNIDEVNEDEIAAWASKVFKRMGSAELTGEEKGIVEGFLNNSVEPIRDIFARDKAGNKLKVGAFDLEVN